MASCKVKYFFWIVFLILDIGIWLGSKFLIFEILIFSFPVNYFTAEDLLQVCVFYEIGLEPGLI